MSKLCGSYLRAGASAGWWLVSGLIGSRKRKSARVPSPAHPGGPGTFLRPEAVGGSSHVPFSSPLLSSSIQDRERIHFGFSSPGSPSVCLHNLQVLALAFNCRPWNKRGEKKNRLWLKKSKWLILCVCVIRMHPQQQKSHFSVPHRTAEE